VLVTIAGATATTGPGSVRQCFYSVPARYAGRRLPVRLAARTVEIYDGPRLVARHDRAVGRYVEVLARLLPAADVASQTQWRMATALPARLQNSHQNGGRLFLIFVADPRTVRSCRSQAPVGDVSVDQVSTARRVVVMRTSAGNSHRVGVVAVAADSDVVDGVPSSPIAVSPITLRRSLERGYEVCR
jgi:hypothetical protein